jgi:hypothetical protein
MTAITTEGPITPTNDETWPAFTADESLEGFFARYPGYRAHLTNIQRAVRNGDVALTVLRDRQSGVPVPVVVAIAPTAKDEVTFFPLAKLFAGNPYEELVGPFDEVARRGQELVQ